MLWAKRLVLVAVVTGVCAAVSAGAAWAAPPANDTFSGAKVIGSVPFSDTEDTTKATLDADDASVETACNTPSGFSRTVSGTRIRHRLTRRCGSTPAARATPWPWVS